MSGHRIPVPSAVIFQFRRWLSLAPWSRGKRDSGTLISRPSLRATNSLVRLNRTLVARAGSMRRLRAEVVIPFGQELVPVVLHDLKDLPKLPRSVRPR